MGAINRNGQTSVKIVGVVRLWLVLENTPRVISIANPLAWTVKMLMKRNQTPVGKRRNIHVLLLFMDRGKSLPVMPFVNVQLKLKRVSKRS